MQEKFSIYKAFELILKTLFQYKEEGNQQYKDGEILKAEEIYQRAIEFSKEKANQLENYEEILNTDSRIKYYTLMSQILSNQSLTFTKLENFPKSLMTAVRAQKYLTIVKQLIKDNDKFNNQFAKLEEKLEYRIRQSWKNMPFILSHYQYSEEVVDELRVGTMLKHKEDEYDFGGGFFWKSQVLMTDFDRDHSKIQGVIINKPYTTPTGRTI
eukprot:TRINITY_DN11882_c0_g1_i1.p2 TRINITY_DN11882_c0_g1~~TRINITY_DN11882_c0_g1_i1.p2  ORF type:complete len:212 (-),score=33.95 TRINITY_DN11882_c0_g1_i1:334-969(-)